MTTKNNVSASTNMDLWMRHSICTVLDHDDMLSLAHFRRKSSTTSAARALVPVKSGRESYVWLPFNLAAMGPDIAQTPPACALLVSFALVFLSS